jgi:hypothetical protein
VRRGSGGRKRGAGAAAESVAPREGASPNSKGDNKVKRTVAMLGTCTVLSTASLNAFAHGDAGAAFLGGVVGGVIGSTILGYPAYPVYAPAPGCRGALCASAGGG